MTAVNPRPAADATPPASLASPAARLLAAHGAGAWLSTGPIGGLGSAAAGVFVLRGLGAGLAYLLNVALARWLGEASFGTFAALSVLVVLLGHASPAGFGESVVRLLPRFISRQRLAEARGFLLFGSLATAAVSLLLAGLGMFLAARFGAVATAPAGAFVMAGLAVPLFAVQDWMEGAARALGRAGTAIGAIYVLRPSAMLAVLAVAWVCGAPADVTTGLMAMLAGLAVSGLALAAAIRRALPMPLRARQPRLRARNWLYVSLPLALALLFDQVATQADMLVLAMVLPPEAAAIYFAAAKSVALAAMAPYAVGIVAGRDFALRLARRDREGLRRDVRAATRLTVWTSAALALALLAAGGLLLTLFGAGYAKGYPVLAILAVGVVLRALAGQGEDLLLVHGQQRLQVLISAVGALAALAGSLAAAPNFGITGVAVAMAAAGILRAVLFGIAARQVSGISPFAGRDTLLPGEVRS